MLHNFVSDLVNHLKTYYTDLVGLTPKIVMAAIVFMIFWFIAGRIQAFSHRRLSKRTNDPLLANFLSLLFRAIVMVFAFLTILNIIGLKNFAASIAAGAGISAFVVGFALKDIGENFLAGILLAFKRPFTVGDIIESTGIKGTVIELNLRDTQIRTSGKNIYIPNALLVKNVIVNYNEDSFLYQGMQIAVDISADISKTIQTIEKEIAATEGVFTDDFHLTSVQANNIESGAVTISIGYWVKTGATISDTQIKSILIQRILKGLKDNKIPFPSNVIEVKNSGTSV